MENNINPDAALDGIRTLSIVVPAFNEVDVLPAFYERLRAVLSRLPLQAEIIYVNDGSSDGTLSLLKQMHKQDNRIAIVSLSRNFGKEIALSAGLDHANGHAVVVIDADLQDPPELIPELIHQWELGYDVVYAKRTVRDGEGLFKKLTAFLFYRLMQGIGRVHIPADTGDFRLLSRRAVDALKKLHEHHRFMKGLFSWIGYPQIAVCYRRDPRYAGKTKWNFSRLLDLAMEGITSFTTAPLKLATYFGLVTALVAFVYAIYVIYKTLVHGDPVRGYPSLMVVILFIGGVQLITIGIIGEYLGRMFDETKGRPLYLVEEFQPSDHFDVVDDLSSSRLSDGFLGHGLVSSFMRNSSLDNDFSGKA